LFGVVLLSPQKLAKTLMIDLELSTSLSLRSRIYLIWKLNRRIERYCVIEDVTGTVAHGYMLGMEQIEHLLKEPDKEQPHWFTQMIDVHLAEGYSNIHKNIPDNFLYAAGHYLLIASCTAEYNQKACTNVARFYDLKVICELLYFAVTNINRCLDLLGSDIALALGNSFNDDLLYLRSIECYQNVELGRYIASNLFSQVYEDEQKETDTTFCFDGCTSNFQNVGLDLQEPQSLYKYVPASTLNIIVSELSFRFTPLCEFNDPFDGQIRPSFNHKADCLIAEVKNILRRHIEEQDELPCLTKFEQTFFKVFESDNVDEAKVLSYLSQIIKTMLEQYTGFYLQQADVESSESETSIMTLLMPCLLLLKLDVKSQVIRKDHVLGLIDKLFGEFEGKGRLFKGDPLYNQAQIELLANNIKVLCLTANSNSQLMWAHYADQHKGALLKLNANKLEQLGLLKEVTYHRAFPESHSIESLAKSYLNFDIKPDDKLLINMLSSKAIDWEYEKEFRIFGNQTKLNSNGIAKIDNNCIEAIYFGARYDYSEMLKFRESKKIAQSDIDIFFGEKDDQCFEINYFPFSNSSIRNADTISIDYLIDTYSYVLDCAVRSLKQEILIYNSRLVSLGKLLDLKKTLAAEKLQELYDVVETSICMVKTTDPESVQEEQKQEGLKNFATAYENLKSILSEDVAQKNIPSMW
jgi:hypothetical protein